MKQTFLMVTAVLGAVVLASGAQNNVLHNGNWWLSISTDEQESYLLGYGDCYVDSLKSKRPPYVENRKLAQLISADYRSVKVKNAELVPAIMKRVWALNPGKNAPPPTRGGETWTNPHGYFDGLWWKGGSDAEKLGFIEGEVDCFNEEAASRFRFAMLASDYFKWLDEAYGLDQSNSTVHSSEDAKIADILLRKGERTANK